MKAAVAQGLVDKVKWGSSTPIANTFMAGQFSPTFDGKLCINSEFGNVDPKGPGRDADVPDHREVHAEDRPAELRPDGLPGREVRDARAAQHQGPGHGEVVQRGRAGLKDHKTDMLCKPWYVGNLPYHIPNNTDITVDYKNGKVVVKERCSRLAPVDKAIAQTRVWEKKYNLNTG